MTIQYDEDGRAMVISEIEDSWGVESFGIGAAIDMGLDGSTTNQNSAAMIIQACRVARQGTLDESTRESFVFLFPPGKSLETIAHQLIDSLGEVLRDPDSLR